MPVQSVLETITQIVREELEDDAIVLTPQTRARDVPGWDSLAHVRIVVAIEDAFDTEFETSAVTGLRNVGDLVDLVDASIG